jgi:hypothetical protein
MVDPLHHHTITTTTLSAAAAAAALLLLRPVIPNQLHPAQPTHTREGLDGVRGDEKAFGSKSHSPPLLFPPFC